MSAHELDITHFFTTAAPMDYSASVMEIGRNAGPDTWDAAIEDSEDYPLLRTDEERESFRQYIRGFGAWTPDEISSMSDVHLNALCIQMVAGDMREAGLDGEISDEVWTEYEKKAEEDEVSSRIGRGDDGRVYFYIGD